MFLSFRIKYTIVIVSLVVLVVLVMLVVLVVLVMHLGTLPPTRPCRVHISELKPAPKDPYKRVVSSVTPSKRLLQRRSKVLKVTQFLDYSFQGICLLHNGTL